jgi:peptidoglycan/LPS O-acetylase OafA/YrhL
VISGFIMLHTNWLEFGQRGAARRFLLRRAARIFPLYWLCLGLPPGAWVVLLVVSCLALGFTVHRSVERPLGRGLRLLVR